MPMSMAPPGAEGDPDLAPHIFALDAPTLTARIGRRLSDDSVVEFGAPYAVVGSRASDQGDILLCDGDGVAGREEARSQAEHHWALIVASAGERWTGGVMPYLADPSLAPLVSRAAAVLAASTAVRLVPRTDERDHVRFVAGETNEAQVGRQGGSSWSHSPPRARSAPPCTRSATPSACGMSSAGRTGTGMSRWSRRTSSWAAFPSSTCSVRMRSASASTTTARSCTTGRTTSRTHRARS